MKNNKSIYFRTNCYLQLFLILTLSVSIVGCGILGEKVKDKIPAKYPKGYVKFYFLKGRLSKLTLLEYTKEWGEYLEGNLKREELTSESTVVKKLGVFGGISPHNSLVISATPGIHYYRLQGVLGVESRMIKVDLKNDMLLRVNIKITRSRERVHGNTFKTTTFTDTNIEKPVSWRAQQDK